MYAIKDTFTITYIYIYIGLNNEITQTNHEVT